MHKDFRKACALTVTASMILSLASCSLLDKAKDQIIDQAGEVADAAVSMKADDLAELCGLDDDAAEELELAFSMNSSSDAVVAAIADTITYEVDEDSAEGSTKDGEGSVDVVFTMVDYEAVAEDEENTADEDTFVAALGDSEETKEVTVSMEFELDDEDWICTNFEGKDFEKLYEFLDFEIAFGGNLVEIAESFADAVIAMDTDALYTICDYASTGYYSSPEDLEYWLSTDLASYPDIAAVVASTLSYEIDEDSATLSDNGSGTIDITFSMVDYQGCAEAGEYEDSAALADALGSWTGERTVQHTWTIGVNDAGESYVDPEWLYDVYDFLYFYPSFSMNFDGDYTSVVDHTEWWWDDGDGVYTNSSEIELDVIPVAAAQDNSFSWDFFYTVAYNGTVVYCSTNKTDSGMYIESYFYPSDVSYLAAPDGNFYAGSYTISFYDLNGNMFATDTCTVENTSNGAYTGTVTEVPVAVGSGSGSAGGSGTVDTDFTFNVGEAVYYDDTFYYATYDPVWFDVPGDAFVDTGIYPSGTSQIQMTVQLNGTYQDSIEYEYYYSATQPTSVDDLTLVDSGVAGITTYGSYDYYDCDFTGTVQDGYYLCALYPDATGDLLAYNVCKVG